MTSGIFPEMPSLNSSSVPKSDHESWVSIQFEEAKKGGDGFGLWSHNCMTCVKAGYPEALQAVIAKSIRSVHINKCRVLILIESDPKNDKVDRKVPVALSEEVERNDIATFPVGSTLWAGPLGWAGAFAQNTHGAVRFTEEEGTFATRRTVKGTPFGFNAKKSKLSYSHRDRAQRLLRTLEP
jgi:hypothetical protein